AARLHDRDGAGALREAGGPARRHRRRCVLTRAAPRVIPIVDGHLDLALNAIAGFDVTASALERRSQGQGEPTVGLPDLVAGGVAVAFATLWVAPRGKSLGDAVPGAVAHEEDFPTYGSPEEAHEHALAQLE